MFTQGEVLITIEILPKSMAELLPAGLGRSEPNAHPFLPPPTGRLKLVNCRPCDLCCMLTLSLSTCLSPSTERTNEPIQPHVRVRRAEAVSATEAHHPMRRDHWHSGGWSPRVQRGHSIFHVRPLCLTSCCLIFIYILLTIHSTAGHSRFRTQPTGRVLASSSSSSSRVAVFVSCLPSGSDSS